MLVGASYEWEISREISKSRGMQFCVVARAATEPWLGEITGVREGVG